MLLGQCVDVGEVDGAGLEDLAAAMLGRAQWRAASGIEAPVVPAHDANLNRRGRCRRKAASLSA